MLSQVPEILVVIQDVPGEVVTYPDAFRFSQAQVGASTMPFFGPHVLSGRWEGWGLASSSFNSLNWQGGPSLICRGSPSLHWFFILPTL